ncbi:MAG: proton-conducting transporter membrane subunit [candidate division WOR-3 bacterium]|nr:NADH/ubiquinone/plastoquinone (complex I) [candidate division WOR-3 bacterium]MCX7837337.1 proton-conducting transporter membrane subunit [candidate division WOR-3 bacterium]MDW8113823.1 proton-conducting transporter membrane subunit [candidate division WOR-3 bacterium]
MNYLPLFTALPLLGAFLTPLLSKIWERLSDIIGSIITTFLLILSIYSIFLLPIFGDLYVYEIGKWPIRPIPLGIVFTFDSLSLLMVLAINLLSFACAVYSINYLDNYTARWKFWTLFLLLIAGLNGVAITGDLFNLFVFIEISAISSYALVAFGVEKEDLEASFKYQVIGEVGGLTILLAIALIYAKTSTLNMADIANTFLNENKGTLFWFIISLLTFGFLIKSALFPFHFWLPDAHSQAPAPISAILSGIFIKTLGVYTLFRLIFNVFGLNRNNAPHYFNLLLILGILSIIITSFITLKQENYKRLLAYSTISQIGYIFVGLGLSNFFGIIGALTLIFAHALSKGLLFLTAGSVEREAGTLDINELTLLKKRMSFYGLVYTLGALSLAGIPPFLGFFPKLFLILGAIKEKMLGLAIILGIFSILTLAYLLKITNKVFTNKEGEEVKENSLSAISFLFLVFLIFIFGIFYFNYLQPNLINKASEVVIRGIEYARLVLMK